MSGRPPLPLIESFREGRAFPHLDSDWAPVTQCLFSSNGLPAIKNWHYFAPYILLKKPRHTGLLYGLSLITPSSERSWGEWHNPGWYIMFFITRYILKLWCVSEYKRQLLVSIIYTVIALTFYSLSICIKPLFVICTWIQITVTCFRPCCFITCRVIFHPQSTLLLNKLYFLFKGF